MNWINTESHKRLVPVDNADFEFEYELDTSTGYPRHCIRNKSGQIIHFFSSKEEADRQIPLLELFTKEIKKGLEAKERFYKRDHPQYYVPTYKEANFTHKALYKGFKPDFEFFNPYHNWFGVSNIFDEGYTSFVTLKREDKEIFLSIDGGTKCIRFTDKDKIQYESDSLPSNEFIEEFLN